MTIDNSNTLRMSLIVLAFNQENFIEKAVQSALNQDYGDLEIIISDDGSRDATFEIISDIAKKYCGPHRLIVRKNELNKGLVDNIKQAVACATGDFIIVAAGDDISYSNRASILADVIQSTDNANAIYTYYTTNEADLDRDYPNSEVYTTVGPILMALNCGGVGKGATYCFRREVFDTLCPLPYFVKSEDKFLPFIAALTGKVYFVPVPTVFYRLPENSLSMQLAKSKKLAIQDPQHITKLSEVTNLAKRDNFHNFLVNRTILLILKIYYKNAMTATENLFVKCYWRVLYYLLRSILFIASKAFRFQI